VRALGGEDPGADPRERLDAGERERLLAEALRLADLTRATILSLVAGGLEVRTKSDGSLVTNADVEAERRFRERLQARAPEAGVVGEELGVTNPGAALCWIIDPIDGTSEFARGAPTYGTVIGVEWHGAPVAAVIDHPAMAVRCYAGYGLGAYCDARPLRLEETVHGPLAGDERLGLPSRSSFLKYGDGGGVFDAIARAHPNFRIYHTCYSHTCAVLGTVDASLEWQVRIWDLAATRLLIEEAGGVYVDLSEPEPEGDGVERICSAAFGRPATVARLVEAVRAALAQPASTPP